MRKANNSKEQNQPTKIMQDSWGMSFVLVFLEYTV